jgi:hypothetical protein
MSKDLTQSETLRQNGGLASMSMSAPAMDGHRFSRRFYSMAERLLPCSHFCNLAIAHQTSGLTGNFVAFKGAFVCFGIGVMLAASSSVVAFLIQNVAIAHPKKAEGNTGRRLRAIGIGMVVAALVSFAVGITVAANAMGNLIAFLDVTAQR